MECSNLDLQTIVTPVDVEIFRRYLWQSRCERDDMAFLLDGFANGFSIRYEGPQKRQDHADNLPFTVGDRFELWDKVMKEVKLGRFAGPYEEIPFQNYAQSPIGLVPKAGNKTRLIFHLSYKFKNGNESINHWTPKEECTVKYNDLDHAVKNCLNLDKEFPDSPCIFYSKTDFSSAFRILPVKISQIRWLAMMAVHPITEQKLFFLDKNLPFGHSISCALFQKVSNAFKHIFEWKTGRKQVVTNYLDDFLFIDSTASGCNELVRKCIQICAEINFPIAEEKTEFAVWKVKFLGIILNGKERQFEIPDDKRVRTINMLKHFLDRKKVTVLEIQRLAGLLNFLNKAIVQGRAFQRRMYSKYSNISDGIVKEKQMKPYYHINLDGEFKADCKVWLNFLDKDVQLAVNRPFLDVSPVLQADLLDFYSDASRAEFLGLGCYYDNRWIYAKWETDYIKNYQPSIAYLELLALTIGVFTWGHLIRNRRVIVHIDNTSARDMINSTGAKGKNDMYLIKQLALCNLRYGTRIFAVYIESAKKYFS